MQPTSKRVTATCTPRVCNEFEVPLFDIGTKDKPLWIKIDKFGYVTKSEAPKEFIPLSENKDDQIIFGHSGIFSTQQKREFQKFTLVKNARELVTSEIVYQMFPPTSLTTLSNTIGSSSFSAQDYITDQLQQVFLPWPLSLLHLLPN